MANSPDKQAALMPIVSTAPGISYVEARFSISGSASLTLPTIGGFTILGVPGGSFEIAASNPTPGTFFVLAAGLAGLGVAKRHRV